MTALNTQEKNRTNPAATTRPQTGQQQRSAASNPQIPREKIAQRAYEIWERSGRPEGQCEQNWRQAEEELRKQNP